MSTKNPKDERKMQDEAKHGQQAEASRKGGQRDPEDEPVTPETRKESAKQLRDAVERVKGEEKKK